MILVSVVVTAEGKCWTVSRDADGVVVLEPPVNPENPRTVMILSRAVDFVKATDDHKP